MKKKLILYVLVMCLSLLLGYLLTAFVTWEIDPGKWEGFTRFLTLFIFGLFGLFIINILYAND